MLQPVPHWEQPALAAQGDSNRRYSCVLEQGQKTWMVWLLLSTLIVMVMYGTVHGPLLLLLCISMMIVSSHSSCPGAVLNIQPNWIKLVLLDIEWAISEHMQYLQKIFQSHHPVSFFTPETQMMEWDLSGTLPWCHCSDQSITRAGEGTCGFHFWNNFKPFLISTALNVFSEQCSVPLKVLNPTSPQCLACSHTPPSCCHIKLHQSAVVRQGIDSDFQGCLQRDGESTMPLCHDGFMWCAVVYHLSLHTKFRCHSQVKVLWVRWATKFFGCH